eukprot:1868538-Pyramimonas_sp.AAC.1
MLRESHPELDLCVLDRFTADFAKWRYGTLETVLRQLSRLDPIRTYLKPEWFRTCQDSQTIASVFDALADDALWKFIVHAGAHVFTPLEHNRYWGMCCTCPEHVQARRDAQARGHAVSIDCFFNSRRLPEALDEVQR